MARQGVSDPRRCTAGRNILEHLAARRVIHVVWWCAIVLRWRGSRSGRPRLAGAAAAAAISAAPAGDGCSELIETDWLAHYEQMAARGEARTASQANRRPGSAPCPDGAAGTRAGALSPRPRLSTLRPAAGDSEARSATRWIFFPNWPHTASMPAACGWSIIRAAPTWCRWPPPPTQGAPGASGSAGRDEDILFLYSPATAAKTRAVRQPAAAAAGSARSGATAPCPRRRRHPLARHRDLGLLFGRLHRHPAQPAYPGHHRRTRRPHLVRLRQQRQRHLVRTGVPGGRTQPHHQLLARLPARPPPDRRAREGRGIRSLRTPMDGRRGHPNAWRWRDAPPPGRAVPVPSAGGR